MNISNDGGGTAIAPSPSSDVGVSTTIIGGAPSSPQKQQQAAAVSTIGSGAANALALLLSEDPLLIRYGLTSYRGGGGGGGGGSEVGAGGVGGDEDDHAATSTDTDDAAYAYAAALLHDEGTNAANGGGWMSSSGEYRQRAAEALAEVDRKLALVESLAQRVSRDSPEEVAGPLLRLHGFDLSKGGGSSGGTNRQQNESFSDDDGDASNSSSNATGAGGAVTLAAARDRADRLRRQSSVLSTVVSRVETTLRRGVTRMDSATLRLSRVLELSAALKMILRLQFEARKVHGAELLSIAGSGSGVGQPHVDLRDLTRAAASVAAMEELLSHPSLAPPSSSSGDEQDGDDDDGEGTEVRAAIDVVERLRPEAEAVATSVRRAAAGLMNELQHGGGGGGTSSSSDTAGGIGGAASLTRLGATLQVYFHLGELSDASWKAASSALAAAERASSQLFHPGAVQKTKDAAREEAKRALVVEQEEEEKRRRRERASKSGGGGGSGGKDGDDQANDDEATGSGTSTKTSAAAKKRAEEAAFERTYRRKLREKRAEAASKWARGVSDAAGRAWDLHRVLARRSDPATRRNFLDVVGESEIPAEFGDAERWMDGGGGRGSSSRGAPEGGGSSEDAKASTSVTMRENRNRTNFSVFSLFWVQMCLGLGGRIQRLLRYDGGALEEEVAALYPAVRSAALDMVTDLHDRMQMGGIGGGGGGSGGIMMGGGLGLGTDDAFSGGGGGGFAWSSSTGGGSGGNGHPGVMGGSAGLEDAAFLGWSGADVDGDWSGADEAAGGGGVRGGGFGGAVGRGGGGADAWTHADSSRVSNGSGGRSEPSSAAASSSASAVFRSAEWAALQGGDETHQSGSNSSDDSQQPMGLAPLRSSFLRLSEMRLRKPLEYLFPESVSVDENGIAIPMLPTLPSRYDLSKIDARVREELSLADPRQGGGELGMTDMMSGAVAGMLKEFCGIAGRAMGDTSGGEDGVLDRRTGAATEELKHNMKIAGVMSTLAAFIRNAPENTFVAPYRPAQSPQHEEAAHACQIALLPALREIETLVKTSVLDPLCRALNRRVSSAIAKMHRGTYLQENIDDSDHNQQGNTTSFVQLHLTDLYDGIDSNYLSQLPNEYASIVASTVATYSIYAFVSNACLVRPLGETIRLRLTQDLADFELALEQLVFKGGTSASLGQICGGKPYAELRAVRQMLFWNMLDDPSLSPAEIAKGLLREPWVKDVRPSSMFHFLFSHAPSLMSSPHHFKRMDPSDYVGVLVKLDGSIDDGEASAWMTTMACCDAYQQRDSVGGGDRSADGDRRIGAILMVLGPELLRRRRQ